MGVTNLEGNQNHDHVKRIACFSVDLINEASKILIDEDEPEKGYINVSFAQASKLHLLA